MGLFSKKPPCPICGGKIPMLLPWKIEGEGVCNACRSKLDIEPGRENNLTMQDFREYLMFFDQNQLLKNQFVISEQIDFGFWDTKIIFDYQNKLFCMSKNPDKTVFEGGQLKSFLIKEDNTLLFEGSAAGIKRYASTVPERARAMEPQIVQFLVSKQMARTLDKMDDGKENGSTRTHYFDMPEPFKKYNVELHFEHPYWSVITCDRNGPSFSNERPDVDDYLRDYQRSTAEIEKLVAAFKAVAFPDAPEQAVSPGMVYGMQAVAPPPTDAIEEIKRYKALMEEGVISQQEFDAKKKQLLGI